MWRDEPQTWYQKQVWRPGWRVALDQRCSWLTRGLDFPTSVRRQRAHRTGNDLVIEKNLVFAFSVPIL